ncbi:MAG: class I SAM-dependent methyltransferase [Methanoregula sp.]|jgi:SAM-dependent methyltransferase|nr:class I SAM-dependent methyltransferase [Methanoregula sp.]
MTANNRSFRTILAQGDEARQYDEYARTIFARVYPVIADQILERTGIIDGSCLEVGSGPALLGIALALLSDLRVTALDSSPKMQAIAYKNIQERCVEKLVIPVTGDVHAIPAADDMFCLVVSRGSYHSWDDLPSAFREIYRVLRPGGMAYVGGGYGSARLRDEVYANRKEHAILDFPGYALPMRFHKFTVGEIQAALDTAGIRDYHIISDDSGFWILFKKNDGKESGLQHRLHFHDGFFFSQ